MLGLVLFTQGVVAVYACATPDAGPVQAYVTEQEAQDLVEYLKSL